VGGGSITDLGGMAAATYKRGIDCIHIPTTLLSMVDAATGGKTGINYYGMKNILGTFHTPVATLIDPEWLSSLSTEQLLSGFGEMLKNAILSDETEWNRLLVYDLDTLDTRSLVPHISSSLAIKEAIVEADPYEEGLRKALNFGHTFGHALEALSEGQIAHGYAVVYGMIAELYLSVTLLDCPKEPLQQLTQLMLHYYGRPQCNCKDRERLMTLMQQDKKNERADEINCTLLQKIGEPIINQVITKEQVAEAWDYLMSL
jgi:3-dehydroquinate synthase